MLFKQHVNIETLFLIFYLNFKSAVCCLQERCYEKTCFFQFASTPSPPPHPKTVVYFSFHFNSIIFCFRYFISWIFCLITFCCRIFVAHILAQKKFKRKTNHFCRSLFFLKLVTHFAAKPKKLIRRFGVGQFEQ